MNSPRALSERRRAKEQRLQALELQSARQGNDTPPHILIEIEELRQDIALMDVIPVSPEVVKEVPGTPGEIILGALVKLTRDVGGLTEQLPSMKDLLQKALIKIHFLEQDRINDTKLREERWHATDKNQVSNEQQFTEIRRSQRISRKHLLGIFMALGILVVLGIVLTLFVLWRFS